MDPAPRRWNSAPFNGNWTSSLLASQDPVAIDSVGFDFIWTEWTDFPRKGGADDYLHEAALANTPPSGTFYDPDHPEAVKRLPSLGAHEHWNNKTLKQYSRNLSTNGVGIELVSLISTTRIFAVDIANPVNGDTFLLGAILDLRCTVTNSASTVQRVEYYRQGTGRLGIASNAPFNLLWTNLPAGQSALQAVAYDAAGYISTSAVVNIQVRAFGLTTAGTLHVDLRASDASAGAATWTNRGALGDFTRYGTPVWIGNVSNTSIAGVQFKGTPDAYIGPRTTSDLDGAGSRTIEVWAMNISPLAAEETLVSLGYRGSAGRICSMIYGTNVNYGAMSQWNTNFDLGWGSASNIPPYNAWHHLVYTYDGNTDSRFYVDGILVTNRVLSAPLNTYTNETILLGAQHANTNNSPPSGQFFSGYINAVRVHGGVLSPGDVAINFACGPYPIKEPVTLLTHPQSRTNYVGTTACFSAAPNDCGPFTVQWLKGVSALPGQTNLSLELTNVQVADAGLYQVLLSNTVNCVTSMPASLVVWPPPTLIGNLLTHTNGLCLRIPASLGSVTLLSSSNLTQWQTVTSFSMGQGDCELTLTATNSDNSFYKLRIE
jgi:hypothetical protein